MKLINLTYNDPKRWEEVRRIAGDDISFFKSIRMRGSGSPQAVLIGAPLEVENLMGETIERKTSNLEIRRNGFVIRFRSRLETMALVCGMDDLSAVQTIRSQEGGMEIHFLMKEGEEVVLQSNVFNAASWNKFLSKHFSRHLEVT